MILVQGKREAQHAARTLNLGSMCGSQPRSTMPSSTVTAAA